MQARRANEGASGLRYSCRVETTEETEKSEESKTIARPLAATKQETRKEGDVTL